MLRRCSGGGVGNARLIAAAASSNASASSPKCILLAALAPDDVSSLSLRPSLPNSAAALARTSADETLPPAGDAMVPPLTIDSSDDVGAPDSNVDPTAGKSADRTLLVRLGVCMCRSSGVWGWRQIRPGGYPDSSSSSSPYP